MGPDGRTVRCAKCEHSWHQAPPDDMPREVDLAVPAAGSIQLPARPKATAGASRGAGLPLLIVVLGALGVAGGYFFRDRIVAEWPKTSQFYELIGVHVNAVGAGLELNNVKFTQQNVNGQLVIEVHGEIFNMTDKDIAVPPLQVVLNDESGNQLFDWTFNIDRPVIHPGETINFKTETKTAPTAAAKMKVTFAGGS